MFVLRKSRCVVSCALLSVVKFGTPKAGLEQVLLEDVSLSCIFLTQILAARTEEWSI